MSNAPTKYSAEAIRSLIVQARRQVVILDADLARVYGVSTKALNQAVKRNLNRFPADFMFQLTRNETVAIQRLRSQFVTLKRGQHIKYLPHAFTEQGAIMAANVLNSPQAVRMSVFVVRAFVRMRPMLMGNPELAEKLVQLEKMLTARLDAHERAIVHVLEQIMRFLNPLPEPAPPRRQIGFHVKESATRYGVRSRRRGVAG